MDSYSFYFNVDNPSQFAEAAEAAAMDEDNDAYYNGSMPIVGWNPNIAGFPLHGRSNALSGLCEIGTGLNLMVSIMILSSKSSLTCLSNSRKRLPVSLIKIITQAGASCPVLYALRSSIFSFFHSRLNYSH